ncbi:MAG: hypothetical protein C0593_13140 [Marinilabiliales bacterium]|nr:MAG: hypothetical protein C0593_13140 [Marinilabiliales bacterium]
MTENNPDLHLNVDFEIAFKHANVAICIVGLNGKFLDVNPEMINLFGYTKTDFLSKEIKDVTHPEDIEISYNQIEKARNSDQRKIKLLKRYIHKSGKIIHADVSSTLLLDQEENPLYFLTYINDITKLEKSEKELLVAHKIAEDNESKYRLIAENTSDGIFVTNKEGKIIYVSKSYVNQLGYTKNEDVGRGPDEIYNIIHPEDRDNLFKSIYKAIEEKKESFKYTFRVKHKKGHYIWREDNARFQFDEHGEHQQSIVICRDITDQINRQEEIKTQLKFSEALNEIAEVIIQNNNTGELLDNTNRIIAETLDVDRTLIYRISFKENQIFALAEWIRKGYEDIEPTKDNYSLDLYKVPFTRILNTKKHLSSHFDDIDPVYKQDNSHILLHQKFKIKSLLWYPFAFDDNEFYVFTLNQILQKREWSVIELKFMNSVARQVTIALMKIKFLEEKKAYEAALENSNKKLKKAVKTAKENQELTNKLIATVPDIIVRTNLEGDIIFVNDALSKTFPFLKKDHVLGMNMRSFIAEEDKQRIEENTKLMFETPLGVQEYKMQAGGDITYEISVNGDVVRDSLGWPQGMVYILRDITSLKEKEKKLKIALEKAKESDRLKSAFLSNMSHEIRTPMNGIMGFTQLLKEPALSGEEKENYIDIIEKSGQRMLGTINDIISISRIESGQDEISYEITDINKVLQEQFEFFETEAGKKGLQFSYDSSLSQDVSQIMTDKRKLENVLTNLIKNAIKFTSKGSITFGCTKLKEKETLEFFVKDTGIGIPENRIDAIFNRFEQADIEDTQVFEGSGLGLAISKAYIEMLNGEISVKSSVNKGSVFSFTIPYVTANDIANEQTHLSHEDSSEPLEDLKIIIAEDDEYSIEYFRSILESTFKELIFTKTGRQTIEAFHNNPDTDIILMDIKMPDINGYDATRKIREEGKNVIIIAQTAFGFEEDESKAMSAGCNGYISKPIKKDALFKLIRSLIPKK